MNQQFLNRQYFQKSMNSHFQGIGQPLHTIPSYQPMIIGGPQPLNSPHSQFTPSQQLIQQQTPQQQQVPGPNQVYFLQNVPLVKSLPQNFAATHNIPTSQQKQNNNVYNSSNNSYGHVISSSRDYNQQQSKPSLNQISTGTLFYSNNNNIPQASKTEERFYDKSQNQIQDIKLQSLSNINSHDFHKIQYPVQANSTVNNYGNLSQLKVQTSKQELKTPEKVSKQQSQYFPQSIVSPQSLQLSAKKIDDTQRLNTLQSETNRIQQDKLNDKLQSIYQQQSDLQSSQHHGKAQFYDVNKIIQLKNQSNVTLQNQNDSVLYNQNGQNINSRIQLNSKQIEQNYNSDQKYKNKLQNYNYTPDHKSNQDLLKDLKNKISKTEQSPQSTNLSPEQLSKSFKMFFQTQSPNINGVKVPLELVYDGTVKETKNPFSNTPDQRKDLESIYHSQTKLQMNDLNKQTQSQLADATQQINILKEEVKQLNQENLTLKIKLSNKSNEYDALFEKHSELEKKYIILQNQISLPSSSCNSSLIIQQEDKNLQILYEIANNKSQTKIPSHNHHDHHHHHTNHRNYSKKDQSHSKTNIPYSDIYQSQNNYTQSQTYNSPSSNNPYIGALDNMSKLYQSVNFESQVFNNNPSLLHSTQPNNHYMNSPSKVYTTEPNKFNSSTVNQPYLGSTSQAQISAASQTQINVPSLLTIDEDYNYKKNTEKKIDQLLQKGLYSPQINQTKVQDKKYNSDQKFLTSSLQLNYQSSFAPMTDLYKQNLIYSSRLPSNTTNQPISQFSLSKYQTIPSSFQYSSSTLPDYQSKLQKDTFLESFSNDYQSKHYGTQHFAK